MTQSFTDSAHRPGGCTKIRFDRRGWVSLAVPLDTHEQVMDAKRLDYWHRVPALFFV